jgi:hypothetical protein
MNGVRLALKCYNQTHVIDEYIFYRYVHLYIVLYCAYRCQLSDHKTNAFDKAK